MKNGRWATVGCKGQELEPREKQEGNWIDVPSSGCAGGLEWPGWGGPSGTSGKEGVGTGGADKQREG